MKVNMEINPQAIVDMLNELCAEDQDAVIQLMNARPYVTLSARDVMTIAGQQLSLIGIVNEILRRHDVHNFLIGADCEFDEESKITKVKFFHLMEIKELNIER